MKKKIYTMAYGWLRRLASIIPIGDCILFESSNGFGGNAGAVYQYMVQNNYQKKYTLVWAVNNKKYEINDGICKVIDYMGHSVWNLYYENRASIVFYDNKPPIKVLKKGVQCIYLTHGCPALKNVKGLIDAGKMSTTALCTSQAFLMNWAGQVNMDKEKMFVCGLPRNDVLFGRKNNEFSKLSSEQFKHIFIWMPTFRKSNIVIDGKQRNDSNKTYYLGIPVVNSDNDLDALNDFLKQSNSCLIIKQHFASSEQENRKKYSNIFIVSSQMEKQLGLDVYSLFLETSALISDYSSVAFDYLLIDKPIGYVVDDLGEYKVGFGLDNILDYMPGEKIRSLEELKSFIQNVLDGNDLYKEERNRVNAWANDYCDGNNSERVVKMFVN